MVIGAGIFSVPQRVAEHNSSVLVVLALWLAVGLMSLAAALVWGELGARMPFAGSDYLVLRESYGRHVAFLFGWKSFFLSAPSSRAALALVAAQYLGILVPSLGPHSVAVGIGILVALGALNMASIAKPTALHATLSVVKVIALFLFVALGLSLGPTAASGWWRASPATSEMQPAGRLALSVMLIFFAYTGWPRIAFVAEEFISPKRDLARVMGWAMALVVGIYLLINLTYFRVLGLDGVRSSSAVGADAMAVVLGAFGSKALAFLVVVSVVGSMSVSIMANSRLYYAMAKGGDFWRWVGVLHPVSRVPARAVAAHLALAIVMLLLRQSFVDLITTSIFVNMIFYLFRVHALFRLRRKGIGDDDGYRVPFYPWLPLGVLFMLATILIVRIVFDWERAGIDLAFLAAGIPASMIWVRWQERQERRSAQTSDR